MDSSKHLAYKGWIDTLSTYPPQEFLLRFDQFFKLLEAENKSKVGILDRKYKQEIEALVEMSNVAAKEMLPLIEIVRKEMTPVSKQLPASAPFEAREFENIATGRTQVMNRYQSETLFHAVRVAIETLVSMGKSDLFEELLTTRDGLTFVDFYKFRGKYPAYAAFITELEAHDKREQKEPWGDYAYLKYRSEFMDGFISTEAGPSMKKTFLARLNSLTWYLLTPDYKQPRQQESQTGIQKLFALSYNPLAIRSDGKTKSPWGNTRGKTQTFAILKLAADKYNRQAASKGHEPEEIKLSYSEIETYLSESKNCNRPLRWKGHHTEKRRLDYLAKNIRSTLPLCDEEMFVERSENNFFICFRPHA